MTATTLPTAYRIIPITETAVDGFGDCCGFRAYARVSFLTAQGKETSLRFCAHHFAQHHPQLSAQCYVTNIDDARRDALGIR